MMASESASTSTSTSTSTNAAAPPPPLPALLCLHGGGSTAGVFRLQCRRLLWNLSSQFRFVFAQAPIEGPPGMGMLPVFASCAPFYRWVNRRFKLGEADVEVTPEPEAAVVDEGLMEVMEENGGVGSFVGVVGFSQGARLVAGLLLRQVVETRDIGASRTAFKFGVIIGGPYPPIALTQSVDVVQDYALLQTIPSVHAWGRDDPVIQGAKQMAELMESENCFVMDFEGGHHLPLRDDEARDLCDMIMAAWFASGGERRVAAGKGIDFGKM